jgi:hypothetical protein
MSKCIKKAVSRQSSNATPSWSGRDSGRRLQTRRMLCSYENTVPALPLASAAASWSWWTAAVT